jgi:1,2-phenylacetyl-CoA epoxidase catalytic subunit
MAVAEPGDDVAELIEILAAHLDATEEMALTEDANRWLGEASAVASDVAESNVSAETLTERVETVVDLLSEVESTGHDEADQHVAAARRAGERILERQ